MEDRSCHRRDHRTAVITGISWTASNAVMLTLDLALFAMGNAVRESLFFKPLQAGVFVGKLLIEVVHGVAQVLWNRLLNALFVVVVLHNKNSLPHLLLDVKG